MNIIATVTIEKLLDQNVNVITETANTFALEIEIQSQTQCKPCNWIEHVLEGNGFHENRNLGFD